MNRSRHVTAYRVPLACEAAPHLGCCTLAKPVLCEIENQTTAAGAWLNRDGTVLAVVWPHTTDYLQSADQLLQILRRHGLTASELAQSEQTDALKDFGSRDGWYRPTELNRLSDQEARIIAARMVSRLRMKTAIGPDQTQLLVTAITEACASTLPNASATCASDRRDEIAAAILTAARAVLNNVSFAVLADAVALGHRPLLGED